LRHAEPEVTDRRTGGEQRQGTGARAGAIGDLPPKRLGDHADQRGDGENQSDFRAGQTGVFAKIEREEWKEDSQRAEVDEPEERQRNRMPHGHEC
jgi:hypothetical protein